MQVDSDKVDSQILAKTGVPIENFWVPLVWKIDNHDLEMEFNP